MTRRTSHARIAIAALLTLVAGMAAGMTAVSAQDAATPAPDAALPHLAHINQGSCAELSHIVYKLDDVATGNADATPVAAVAATPAAGGTVKTSTTDIEVALDDLLADPHAINIHESIEAVDTYVACGDITGTPADGVLEIELAEQNGSGISGMATLTDNGDGTTTVVIELVQGEPGPAGTPEATPVS